MKTNKVIKKITVGFVIQEFTNDGKFLKQEFVAGDQVDYEDENGLEIEPQPDLYHNFDMK